MDSFSPDTLRNRVRNRAAELGFDAVGFTDIALDQYLPHLDEWLANDFHGQMRWMQDRYRLRANPAELVDDCVCVISFRMNYQAAETQPLSILENPDNAYVSRYALGRDYHKVIRNRLGKLAEQLREWSSESIGIRAFVDSAPVLEKPLAEKAGLGWIGKNTLLLNKNSGSWFFLGELVTTLPLAEDSERQADQCGKCKACLTVCPTDAFPRPYQLDARRCISYLTIEHHGVIDEEFREPMGNRVFGCDDCQLACPWNRYAKFSDEDDFQPRHKLDNARIVELINWSESEFLEKTAGSPIRRIGYARWLRNLAIGLGNGTPSSEAIAALERAGQHDSMVKQHTDWAINRLSTATRNSQHG